MMNDPDINQNQQKNRARPALLSVLCVLTFIGSGISSISFLMVYFSYQEVIPMIHELSEVFPGVELFAKAGKNFFLTGFILYFLSLFGGSMMWQLRKPGFHFYTAAQVMIVLLPVVYIKGFPFPFLEASVTAIFILLYSKFLKIMK